MMADLSAVLETLEHRWMRAWIARDARVLKSITASNFILLTSSRPPVILDRRSWLEAATGRYHCKSYRFGEIYVRGHGSTALFAAPLEIEATMDGHDWSGTFWVSDVWRKGRVRRGWKLVERIVSRAEEKADIPAAIRSLQLWR